MNTTGTQGGLAEAQATIDRIFTSGLYGINPVLQNDEMYDDVSNYVDLDKMLQCNIETVENFPARIYPKHQKIEKNFLKKLHDSAFVKETKELIVLVQTVFLKTFKIFIKLLLVADKKCERILYYFDHAEKEPQLFEHVVAFGPKDQTVYTNPYFSRRKKVVKIPVFAVITSEQLPQSIFNIRRKKEPVRDAKKNASIQKRSKKGGIFYQVTSLVFSELLLGNHLKKVDSI